MQFLLILTLTVAPLVVKALAPRQAATQITVNPAVKYQTIDGFGFSEAFQRANLIVNLPADKQQYVLDLLFNTSTGAGFTILRNGIGSTPNSNNDYMNTIEPTSPGSPSAAPKYVWDGKDSGQLFVSKAALRYGVKTIYANAWSAPGFMKTNNNDANGGTLCGLSGAKCNSGDWRQAYADYLVQYIKFYQQEGVPITHIGFLNEPDFTTSYASMLSSGAQSAEFIKILSPTLAAANMSDISIVCCENTGWSIASQVVSQIRSAGAEPLVGVYSSHTYTSGLGGPLSSTKKVWQSEYADLSGAWTTAWYSNGGAGEGLTWANTVHQAVTGSNVTAYLYWIGTQSGNTNEKLIKVENNQITVSKRLWAMAQWARFVLPGAVRIQAGTVNGLRTSAFQNVDGSLAVQVINQGNNAASVSVKPSTPAASAKAWLTDASHDLNSTSVVVNSDGSVAGSVPGRGMVTFIIGGNSTARV